MPLPRFRYKLIKCNASDLSSPPQNLCVSIRCIFRINSLRLECYEEVNNLSQQVSAWMTSEKAQFHFPVPAIRRGIPLTVFFYYVIIDILLLLLGLLCRRHIRILVCGWNHLLFLLVNSLWFYSFSPGFWFWQECFFLKWPLIQVH